MNHVALGVLPALFPIIRRDIPLSYTEMGMLGTAVALIAAITNYLSGRLADKKGAEKILAGGLTVLSLAVLVTAYIKCFLEFLVTRILEGIGSGSWHPPAATYTAKKFPKKRLGFAFSIQGSAGIVGSAVAPLFVVPLAAIYNWRVSLLFSGGIVLLVAIILLFTLTRKDIVEADSCNNTIENSSRSNIEMSRGISAISFAHFIILMILLVIARNSAFRTIIYFTSIFLNDIGNYDPIMSGLLTSVVLGFGAIGGLLGGKVVDRFSSLFTLRISTFSAGVIFVVLFFYQKNILFLLSLVTLLFFFGMPGLESYVVKMSSSEKRGEVYGIIFSVGPIVGAFSPMFFGYIADLFGLQYVFIIVAFLLISGFVITLLLPKD